MRTIPTLRLSVLSFFMMALLIAGSAKSEDISLRQWSSRVIPLPKQIDVRGSRTVPADALSLLVPDLHDRLLTTATALLQPFVHGRQGFIIRMALTTDAEHCPARVQRALATAPNGDQAYAIEPIDENGEFSGLLLAANTPQGLLYAARTLAHLLSARSPHGARLEIPRATVLDWPDLAERGEWFGGGNFPNLQWMADHKFNVIEVQPPLGFGKDGSPQANLDQKMVDNVATLGIHVVPIIWHMEQLAITGLFRYHPEVASTPDPSKPLPTDYEPGVCFSQPTTIEILATWMQQLLAMQGVNEIMVWVSEDASPCYCRLCRGREPYGNEVRGIQEAFEKARQRRPGAILQILTTQGSYPVNDKILAAAAPQTRIVYYDGSRTYDSSHRPMIYPLLEDYARSGRWLGVYPQFTNSWRTVFPFTGPQFMQARMREFVDKRLSGVYGYATPSNRYYEFNVAAAAEWAWNSHGRNPAEFSEAYARAVGISPPERFAEWAVMIGDVGWDLAGNRAIQRLISPGQALFEDKQYRGAHKFEDLRPLQFGQAYLSEFPSRSYFDARVAQANRALRLAQALGNEQMVDESRSVLGTLRLLDGLVQLSEARDLPQGRRIAAARDALLNIDDAACELTQSLYRWGTTVNPLPRTALPSRLRDTVDFASAVASAAWDIGRDLGIPDPHAEYHLRPVREWREDGTNQGAIHSLWADVTSLADGAGEYDVRFQFLDGKAGLDVHSVALFRGPQGEHEEPLAVDPWNTHVSAYADYWLPVSQSGDGSPTRGEPLRLKMDVSLPRPQVPGERATSHGVILICKSWRGSGKLK